MKKLIILLIFITGCASTPTKSDRYRFCRYPSVDCDLAGNCNKKDPRLKEFDDFCMPSEIIEALELRGYE